jgi:hypothetical protein
MKRIPLYHYVAQNNPSGGARVIEHFNLRPPRGKEDIARGLRYVMINFGEEGFRAIAKEHPDRELILDSAEVVTLPVGETESKSGSCGCSSNAEGNGNGKSNPTHDAPNQDLIDEVKALKLKEKQRSEKEEEKKKLTKEDVASEVKKVLGDTKPFIKDTLPYIAVGGMALFLFYGALKAK